MTMFVERDAIGSVKGVYANPQPGYAEEELSDDHPDVVAFRHPAPTVALVKAEAERRILAIMPEYQQRNVMALALETIQQHGPDPAQWPSQLQAINTAAMAKWTQIKALRAKSDEIEGMSPIPADYKNDEYWA